ncbi:hypothetical protein N7517_004872 [Penicillium concentricum]|uniref:Uncharacterized protein n=1 Tax=Penicillium concentricum TaxID=293559 RepID=A0A9W9VB35_9EURO|nr:uncharacterized protein N7517_004872 [Penicillium concentricum]KAJ5372866.1 hypothetical protein N7517_004872 [Penicillium concentricum]
MENSNYFSRFPDFQTARSTSAIAEFDRLASQRNWSQGSKKYRSERAKFLVSEFDTHFGTDATKLESWQALCVEVKVQSPTESISQCRKKALAKVHVNLVDLVDSRRTGKKVKRFPSHRALTEYTIDTRKIFPKAAAKKDGFLKALLRVIF